MEPNRPPDLCYAHTKAAPPTKHHLQSNEYQGSTYGGNLNQGRQSQNRNPSNSQLQQPNDSGRTNNGSGNQFSKKKKSHSMRTEEQRAYSELYARRLKEEEDNFRMARPNLENPIEFPTLPGVDCSTKTPAVTSSTSNNTNIPAAFCTPVQSGIIAIESVSNNPAPINSSRVDSKGHNSSKTGINHVLEAIFCNKHESAVGSDIVVADLDEMDTVYAGNAQNVAGNSDLTGQGAVNFDKCVDKVPEFGSKSDCGKYSCSHPQQSSNFQERDGDRFHCC